MEVLRRKVLAEKIVRFDVEYAANVSCASDSPPLSENVLSEIGQPVLLRNADAVLH